MGRALIKMQSYEEKNPVNKCEKIDFDSKNKIDEIFTHYSKKLNNKNT